MAERPKGFGYTAELSEKTASKYDTGMARELLQWMSAVLGEQFADMDPGPDSMHSLLSDGKVLCRLANEIGKGQINIKPNDSKMAFKQMENINFFLEATYKLGVNKADMFQTVDLYEKTNMTQVLTGIEAFARKATKLGYAGPSLGAKEADENKRDFTEEQLKSGKGVIGLQMGSNKGASQAGSYMGKPRGILGVDK